MCPLAVLSHLRPRFAYTTYILGNYGHARSQGGRQAAATKPPLYTTRICLEEYKLYGILYDARYIFCPTHVAKKNGTMIFPFFIDTALSSAWSLRTLAIISIHRVRTLLRLSYVHTAEGFRFDCFSLCVGPSVGIKLLSPGAHNMMKLPELRW